MTDPRWGDQWSSVALPERPPEHPETELNRRRARRRRVRRSAVRWGLVALGVVAGAFVVAGVWVALSALSARDDLTAAADGVVRLRAQVEQGEDTTATLRALQDHAAAAHRATTGPQWALVGALPVAGRNTHAVQTVAEVVDDLAQDALPALVDATHVLDPATVAPTGGAIDLDPIQEVGPQVVAADQAVASARDRLAAIDVDRLVGVLADPVTELRGQVTDVARTTATASRAVRLLPGMLGADGPRQYLLLVQNNAEQRATGGIPGAVLLLRADDGHVSIVDERAANALTLATPALPVEEDDAQLFSPGFGTSMLDVTATPDFPRTGQLARALWAQTVGGDVDGVLSVDPGALADVLGATGPVQLADGRSLTSDNAEQVLLNQTYLDTDDPHAQDAFFTSTARTVFDTLMAGTGAGDGLLDALATAARDGRILVWSADPGEQRLLSGTVLSGELVGRRGTSPVVGVYLEDAGAAKTGYYLQPEIAVAATACRPDGSQELDVRVTLTSTAPADAADLPGYLVGRPNHVVTPGEIWTNVLVTAPTAGAIASHTVSTGEPGLFSRTYDGLAVGGRTVKLAPGATFTLDLTIRTGPGQSGTPVVRTTPTALGTSPTVKGLPCG